MILGFSLKNCFAHHPYFGITHTILGTIWWETVMVCQIFIFVALLIFSFCFLLAFSLESFGLTLFYIYFSISYYIL